MSDKQNNDKAFDGLFAQQLKGHVASPPTDMWEKIRKNTASEKRRRLLRWILLNDGVFMILILLVSVMNCASFGGELSVEMSNENQTKVENEEIENRTRQTQDEMNKNLVSTVLSAKIDGPESSAESETSSQFSASQKKLKTERSDTRSEKQTVSKSSLDKSIFTNRSSDSNRGLASGEQANDFGTVSNSSKNDTTNSKTPFNNLTEDEIEKIVEAALKKNEPNSAPDEDENSIALVIDKDVSGENEKEMEDEIIETEFDSISNETAQVNDSETGESDTTESTAELVEAEVTSEEATSEEVATAEVTIDGETVNEQEKQEEEIATIDLADTTGIATADSADVLKPKDLVGKKNHELFAGLHANFNLPLIFNQNTYEVFNGKELAYKPNFGLASGTRIGYTYKKQYGFETGFIFSSKQGQDYEETFKGVKARKQVKLQYFNIPLVLRYKFKEKKAKKFPSPWVINLGAQVDLLQSATITYNGNDFPLDSIQNPQADDKDYFRATTISAVLGLEREVYFTKFLFLGIGIRTTFSSDINAKDRPVMNDGKGYMKSHNFTFGFTLSLNFAGQL
ncbi:MAG: outer membrane beta-barrel protein [Flavobacteriales bacterium]|nr:outer membrane beta-barrel protein [Flavobacteriales bacterium]